MHDILRAATQLVANALQIPEFPEFQVRTAPTTIIISGPTDRRNASHKDNGIWICACPSHTRVVVRPFQEYNETKRFEHANPDFPTNLVAYIEEALAAWLDWLDIFDQ